MLKLVYGPAACGKSTYVYNRILKDLKQGKKALLIVPEQNVLLAERCITDMSNDVSTIDLEVLSYRRLANQVFRTFGGLSFNDLNEGARLLVMWRALREASAFLKVYNNFDDRNTSLTELMLSTVDELKQFAITPLMLEKAAEKLGEKYKSLSDKLHDISFIYSTYQVLLSKEYNDPSDELTRLADRLDNNNFFKDYNVYIDAFDSFTPQQYKIIDHIIEQADGICISLCYDIKDKSGVFSTTEITYKKLKKIADRFNKGVNEVYLENSLGFENKAIEYVSKNLWCHSVQGEDFTGDDTGVDTIACHDKFEECEAVVCDIIKKVRDGVRYKDILVIARDISSYEGIIDCELENNGIPFFMSRRTDITTKPLFKLILAALAIKNKGWRFNDVISYVKTGLVGITFDECDILENYASAWNINGRRWYDGIDWNMNPDGFVEKITDDGAELLNKANEIRKKIVPPLVKFFDSIGGTTVSDVTVALYDFLCELNIKERIENKAAECRRNCNFSEEKELVQLWNLLISALDDIVEFAGEMKIDGLSYATILNLVLSKIGIGTIPARVDQVMLGSASMIRTGSVKHVYLIGVNEGVFPKTAEENCIFNDNDKFILKSVDVELSPGTNRLASDELYWFYKSISTARESLTLTYCVSDLKGASGNISVAGSRVNFLLNNKPFINYAEVPAENKIEGKNTALKILALNRDNEIGIALQRYFEKNNIYGGLAEFLDTSLDAGVSDIDDKLAKEIYKGNMSTSQSKIDSYVKCSFEYHCKYILKLQEKKTAVFRNNDIGNFVHIVLERFMSRIATDNGIDTDIDNKTVVNLIDEIIDDYVKSACQGMSENSPRFMQLIKRLKRTTILLVRNILAEFRQSEFVPSFFELPISYENENGVEPYEIMLQDGTKLFMRGMVDRVDTFKKGKDVYIRIVDYKTGVKTFSPDDIEKGLNLQMLLYLFAIWNTKRNGFKDRIKCDGEILPAGILYFAAKAPDFAIESDGDIENAYTIAENSIERVGMLVNDIDILKAMDKNLEQKYIPVKLYKNGNLSNAKYLKTVEEFGELSRKIDGILNKIAMDMKSGSVKAEPMEMNKKKDSPCVYCRMKAVCRRLGKEEDDEQ
ncbi:MAG: exodeoxyribonuclease V subunit gamma [Clostridia bacterium]|nr:exodeoxyribonuclease V subunit gamma [Clostridia bacterium]